MKKEEDIKEENVSRDGHGREKQSETDEERERGMRENSEKKKGREMEKEDQSSKEVRRGICFSPQTNH